MGIGTTTVPDPEYVGEGKLTPPPCELANEAKVVGGLLMGTCSAPEVTIAQANKRMALKASDADLSLLMSFFHRILE